VNVPHASPIHWTEIDAIADSPVAKATADLVITGTEDGSGVPVAERRADIARDHGHADYRLVSAETLRRISTTLREGADAYTELLRNLGQFTKTVPVEQWPAEMRAAHEMLTAARNAQE
jgi:hypothetical protein